MRPTHARFLTIVLLIPASSGWADRPPETAPIESPAPLCPERFPGLRRPVLERYEGENGYSFRGRSVLWCYYPSREWLRAPRFLNDEPGGIGDRSTR